MIRSVWGRALVVSSLFVFLLGMMTCADVRDEFARETGLDVNLINVIQVDVNGVELTIVFVFINERALSSHVAPELRQTLLPYVGRNAFYVNPSVKDVLSWFDYSPLSIAVQQVGGDVYWPPASAWVEITPGFMNGVFEANPAGPEQGSGSEGLLVLGDAIDSTKPFELLFRGERTRFEVSQAPVGSSKLFSSTPSQTPVSVPFLEDVTTLAELLALDEVTSESMAGLLELDRSLVRVLDLTQRGEALRFVFVHLTEAVRSGALGADLLERLDPLIGTSAVMVWVYSPTGAAFSAWNFYVQQQGTNFVFFSAASFVELTEGFLRTERLAPGGVVAGVIRLPKNVNGSLPFSIHFGTAGVSFP